MSRYLAFDLGAESGRAVVGHLDGGHLHLEELHRFPNAPVRLLDSLHWDVLRLWSEIKQGLTVAFKRHGTDFASVGLDTWGVDFALLAADDTLLGNPYHYRDRRTEGMLEEAFQIMPRKAIYERTGAQFMQINSLYQLLVMALRDSPALKAADRFLNMPDLLNFWLSGVKASEFTVATTTQCFDPREGDWARSMLDALGIPPHVFGAMVQPGTVLGSLLPSVAQETGGRAIPVVASASHDTAAAVAATPAAGQDHIFLSSGTWSLMGVEVPDPIISSKSLAYDITNEGGVSGTFRFLKNIPGLWLVQECRSAWKRAGTHYSYADLAQAAAEAPAFGPMLPATDGRFLAPGRMPERIRDFCGETAQGVPQTPGEFVRCVLESLALEYRWVAEHLDEAVGRHLPTIHIFGGGSQNRILNQLAADATGRMVIAGPVEATAAGNVLVQAMALGHIADLNEGRDVIRRSFNLSAHEPSGDPRWEDAYQRYLGLREPQSR